MIDLRTTEEILREQIKDLNKLLDVKNQRILELEALRSIPSIVSVNHTVSQWQPTCSTDVNINNTSNCEVSTKCSNCSCEGK